MDKETEKKLIEIGKRMFDDEDERQEFYLGAIAAIPKYLPDRGALISFLSRCGVNKAKNYIEHNKYYKDNHRRYNQSELNSLW